MLTHCRHVQASLFDNSMKNRLHHQNNYQCHLHHHWQKCVSEQKSKKKKMEDVPQHFILPLSVGLSKTSTSSDSQSEMLTSVVGLNVTPTQHCLTIWLGSRFCTLTGHLNCINKVFPVLEIQYQANNRYSSSIPFNSALTCWFFDGGEEFWLWILTFSASIWHNSQWIAFLVLQNKFLRFLIVQSSAHHQKQQLWT